MPNASSFGHIYTEIATVKIRVQIHSIIKIVAVSRSRCLPRITSSTIDRIVIAWSTAAIEPCGANVANSSADVGMHSATYELTAKLLYAGG